MSWRTAGESITGSKLSLSWNQSKGDETNCHRESLTPPNHIQDMDKSNEQVYFSSGLNPLPPHTRNDPIPLNQILFMQPHYFRQSRFSGKA